MNSSILQRGLGATLLAAFYERELAHRVERYGHIAHVWSSFEARDSLDLPPRARGVNSFQVMDDGRRWCILSATWDIETPDHPLPPQFERANPAGH